MIDVDEVKQAITLTNEGKFKEAKAIYDRLLLEYPNESALLSVVGLFYISLRDFDNAIKYLKQACDIKETFGTLSALGFAEYERGNYKEAASVLENSLNLGSSVEAYHKLILSLFEIKSYKKAIEYTEKMQELYPEDYRTVANKVKSLTQLGKLREAEALCVEYLKKNPNISTLWHHLGLLKELIYSDDRAAIECYKIAGKFGNIGAEYNIAVAYQKLGEYEQAENYYKIMLQKFPDDISTLTSLGMCYLLQKKFHEGYDLFYKRSENKISKYTTNLKKQNEPLNDEFVVVCDQGFGDHIQFIRYLPFLKGKKFKVAVHKSLKKLFEKNYPDFEFINYDEINPEIQYIRLTDLAYILDMDFDNIPFAEGYLDVEAGNIQNEKLKVGLCWEAGAAGIRGMINRTIHVKCFEPFFGLKNVQIYSFQYNDTFEGNKKYPQMINLAKDFKDFYDTAKALKAMDAVITVDTSVAHLAGALGVKTYLLLPYAADWRWFTDTKTTPWYNSVQIFKQTDNISWQEPLENILELIE